MSLNVDASRRAAAARTVAEPLILRAELLRRVRNFFGGRGFLEVETPLLSSDLILDREIEPFCVRAGLQTGEASPTQYLQTSPEAHMKRLLVRGAGPIFQVTRSFRAGERGRLHNQEFTIVEWYRPGDGMHAGMSLLSDLCDALLARGAARRTTYREAFQRHAGLDPFTASTAEFRAAVSRSGDDPPAISSQDRDAWLDYLMATCVGSRLGLPEPEILYDYPASQAALATIRAEAIPVAERFELFVDGVELANGYHEETSATELARRQAALRQEREARGMPPLVSTNRWLNDLATGLPPCTGVALGLDRVVMLAAGAKRLSEVMPLVED